MKYLFSIFVVLAVSFLFTTIYVIDENLHVIFCDVGQGDATLISYKNIQVLIDVGRNEKVLSCLGEYMPKFDNSIEYLVVTHTDFDHIGGLNALFSSFFVENIILSADVIIIDDFIMETKLNQRDIAHTEVIFASEIEQIWVGNKLGVSIVSPEGHYRENKTDFYEKSETILSDANHLFSNSTTKLYSKNNLSTVLNVIFDDFSLLLTGDGEKEQEEALLSRGLIRDIDVLKIPHHGSNTSSTPSFLRKARPELSVISSGENNQYGHPSPLVEQRIFEVGSRIARTDKMGSVHIVSNGSTFWIEPK